MGLATGVALSRRRPPDLTAAAISNRPNILAEARSSAQQGRADGTVRALTGSPAETAGTKEDQRKEYTHESHTDCDERLDWNRPTQKGRSIDSQKRSLRHDCHRLRSAVLCTASGLDRFINVF